MGKGKGCSCVVGCGDRVMSWLLSVLENVGSGPLMMNWMHCTEIDYVGGMKVFYLPN